MPQQHPMPGDNEITPAGNTLLDEVLNLARVLRGSGIPVSTPEVMDALAILVLLPFHDRMLVRQVLLATLIKNRDWYRVFEVAFAHTIAPRLLDAQFIDTQAGPAG